MVEQIVIIECRPMSRLFATVALVSVITLAGVQASHAIELPSFLQSGDKFCTNQADFDDLVAHGHVRAGSAIETCVTVLKPTRVAIVGGQGGTKSMVRIMSGPYAYSVGWTNGALPLAK